MKTFWLALSLALSAGAAARVPDNSPGWLPDDGPAALQLDRSALPADWVTVDGTYARVQGPADQDALLLRLANHAAASLPALAARLRVPIGDTVTISVVDRDVDFRTLQPGQPPTWADATAYPAAGRIFLRAPGLRNGTDTRLEQVLDHELVHVLLGRAFAPAQPPTWLQEGIARVFAGEFGPEEGALLASGAPLMRLGELERGFPSDAARARLAYAQSADLVVWIEQQYGEEALPKLIHALAREQDIHAAVWSATGAALPDIEAAWLGRLEAGPPTWLTWFDQGELLWAVGAVSLVGAGWMRRTAFHRRMAERAAEEALVDQVVAAARGRSGSPWPA